MQIFEVSWKKSTKFAIIFFPYRKYGNSSLLEAEEEREKELAGGAFLLSFISLREPEHNVP